MVKMSEPLQKKSRSSSASQAYSRNTTWPVLRKKQIQELIDEEMQKMKEDRAVSRAHKKVLDMRSDFPDMPRYECNRKSNGIIGSILK